MNEISSKKIVFLNYFLACIIIIIHCGDIQSLNGFHDIINEQRWLKNFFYIMDLICRCAVPTYFALSGYLMFRNINWNNIKRKMVSRCKTVLFPYFLWTIIFLFVYFVLEKVPYIGNRISFDFSWEMINPPLWFLLRLFILQLFAGVILFLFQKIKYYNIIWIFLICIMDVIVGFSYHNPLHWAFEFYLGCYIGYFYSKRVEDNSDLKKLPYWGRCLLLLVCILLYFCLPQRVIGPFLIWLIMDMLENVPIRQYMKNSFFLMATHYFVVRCTREILVMILGITQLSMILIYILTIAFSILVCTFMSIVLRRIMPKIYGIACGGR